MVRYRPAPNRVHAQGGAVDEARARKHALLERVMRVAIAAVAVACVLPVVAFLLTGPSARDSAAATPRALGVRTFQARATPPTPPHDVSAARRQAHSRTRRRRARRASCRGAPLRTSSPVERLVLRPRRSALAGSEVGFRTQGGAPGLGWGVQQPKHFVREVLSPRNGAHANGASTVWAVYFYKPYCGACRRLRPVVEGLGSTVTADDLRFAAVDCVTCVCHSVPSSSSLREGRRRSAAPLKLNPQSRVHARVWTCITSHAHFLSATIHTRLELMHGRTQ